LSTLILIEGDWLMRHGSMISSFTPPFGARIKGAAILFVLMLILGIGATEARGQFFDEVLWPPVPEIVPPGEEVVQGETVVVGIKLEPDPGLYVYRDKLRVEMGVQEGAAYKEMAVPEGRQVPDVVEPDKMVPVLENSFVIQVVFDVQAGIGETVKLDGVLHLQGCTDSICYPPEQLAFAWDGVVTDSRGDGRTGFDGEDRSQGLVEAESEDRAADGGEWTPVEEQTSETGLQIFLKILGAFGAGILLSLTPCVLPMIPITSAIILRFSKGGVLSALVSSCIYVFGLAITYALAGVAVSFLGGAIRSALNSPWFLGAIALVFVVLSLSMFGLFDIALPSGVTGKLQQSSSKAGKNRIGLLFMGMVSGLIVGPCVTAPLAGLLLWIAQTGSPMIGFWTMFALAWGMGLLIIAAGISTGFVPKAGEWTEWFKKFFGFIMLWGALYFLRNLVGEAGFELGTALLLVIAAVFLGGFDTLPADARWGMRLKKLIGVLLMMGSFFMAFDHFNTPSDVVPQQKEAFQPGGKAQLQAALDQRRPAVLYFTADWCDICKTLKNETLTHPDVAYALEGIASLKVDFDDSEGLVDQFKVQGPPTVVFIDEEGKERSDLRFSGFKSAAELVELLVRLKS
jgi:thiol:disulfide interchange protein DsbD